MGRLSVIKPIASNWYVLAVVLGALGLILGSMVFFNVWPGKPKIGVINIPSTIISDRSAFEIGAMLDYAMREDSIKGVVISLSSPGGSAAASEELFFETAKLREKKPVVIVMNELVASGGYMMSLGGNFLYAKPSSFIGGIGVILSPVPPVLARLPNERDVLTGPFKAQGGDRRHFVSLTDQLKQAFVQMVATERGNKLTRPLSEVTRGNIYSGSEAVRLGLVDAIGSRTDAIEKAADLAHVSNYDLVDINAEVSRQMNQRLQRIRAPLDSIGAGPALAAQRPLLAGNTIGEESSSGSGILDDGLDPDGFRTLPLPGGIGEDPRTALPNFPLEINGPNAYYLYVGPSP